MIVMELWIIMDNEDLVDSEADSRVDLMLEILVIYSLHFLEVDSEDKQEEDLEKELIYEKISRCDFVSRLKILFWGELGKLNSNALQLVITVVERAEKQKPVKAVTVMDKFANVYKRYLV